LLKRKTKKIRGEKYFRQLNCFGIKTNVLYVKMGNDLKIMEKQKTNLRGSVGPRRFREFGKYPLFCNLLFQFN
jgi:hypothetical protein